MGFRSGFITISGRPNVGKSTLINRLLSHKIAIMSPKAQTTRNKIQGIYNAPDCQIVFIDTPGIHKPKNKLGERMNRSAIGATREVEAVLLVSDVTEAYGGGDEYVLNLLKNVTSPIFLLLNKVDLITKEEYDIRKAEWVEKHNFHSIIPISAQEGINIDLLLEQIKALLPEGPKYYPDNVMSDHPESFIMAELVREKILLLTREEVPHSVAVVIERNRVNSTGSVEVDATIIVDRDSQKGIIIGQKGSMLKNIGMLARKDMEALLGSKVILHTFVRVESGWRDNVRSLNEFGYRED